MTQLARSVAALLAALAFALALAQDTASQDAASQDTLTVAGENYALTDTLPTDPAIRTGVLDNGLRYYLRPNSEPRNRAELALVVNAGSILEDDDQQGLAHFLEHLLFNGTENFPEQDLINFLERTGMRFGPDVNAYTSFDETVYTLQIPLDDEEIVSSAFQVLADWAGAALLDEAQIERERGVIVEEWRARDLNASGRINKEVYPLLFGESRYAQRLPIGDMDVVRSAPREAFLRFYETWYRPDLMAVVAVGDFDPEDFEARIRAAFAGLENPPDAPERAVFDLPDQTGTVYRVVTDPEFPATVAQLIYRQDATPLQTVQDFRDLLAAQLFSSMTNQRLAERARAEDAPYLGASMSYGGLTRDAETLSFGVQTEEGKLETGLSAMLEEVARIARAGFTEGELARAKADIDAAIRQNYAQRDDVPSAAWRDALTDSFLTGFVVTSNDADFELNAQLLPEIALAEVNQLAAELATQEDRLLLVVMPEKADLTPPTPEQLEDLVNEVAGLELAGYEDAAPDAPLLASVPEPAAVVARQRYEAVGVHELTLANGVRVVVKPTDFRRSEVLLSARSFGGTSLVADEDYRNAAVATSVVSESGVGPWDRTALTRQLAGKRVSLSVSIGDLTEGLSGSAETVDLETLFQLAHLYFSAPRFEEGALRRVQDSLRSSVLNRDSLPQAALQDAVTEARWGDAPRYQPWTLAMVDALDLARTEAIYRARFADASDFIFFVVGDVELDTVTDLAARYLGSLPSRPGRERYRNVQPPLRMDTFNRDVFRGQDAQSVVHLRFDGPFFLLERKSRYAQSVLQAALDIMVREDIREARGGAYSPSAFAGLQEDPSPRSSLGVQFTTDPERARELKAATLDVLNRIKREGPGADNLHKAKAQVLRAYEENLEQNGYWVSVLERYFFYSPEEPPETVLSLPDIVATITEADVQELAQRFVVPERLVEVILYPEGFVPGE